MRSPGQVRLTIVELGGIEPATGVLGCVGTFGNVLLNRRFGHTVPTSMLPDPACLIAFVINL